MDMSVNKKLRISSALTGNTVTIYLSGHFSFDSHREFKSAYKAFLNDAKIGHIIVNLAEVNFLDSSALGMLLVLREQAMTASKLISLSRPSSIALRTFDISSFNKIFTIN